MPTRRHKIAPERTGLTQAAIEAWKAGDFHALNHELGIGPHQISPFDAISARPLATSTDSVWARSWPKALQLRKRLMLVAGPPGRMTIHGEPLGPAKRADETP
jgi:hypothetical protein